MGIEANKELVTHFWQAFSEGTHSSLRFVHK